MVLNGDSTHPNPFRNPMPFNHFAHFYYPDRIYKGWPDSVHDTAPIKPRFNVFTDTTFGWRMYLAAKKGFVLSTAAAYFDIMAVTKPKTPRAKLGRFLHITTPNTLAFMSYIAARDFLGVVSEKMGGTRTDGWTFFAGMAAPGAICGTWFKSVNAGVVISVYGGLIMYLYKVACDTGIPFLPYSSDMSQKKRGWDEDFHTGSINRWQWKGLPLYDRLDTDSDWKKWEDKEAAATK